MELDEKGPKMSNLLSKAEAWIAGDPDPITSAELRGLVDSNDLQTLERAMGASLQFGTAGIRGRVGPGSGQMNRAVVIRTTAGLARFLLDRHEGAPAQPVVVGFDARSTSRQFAEDTVGVLAAAGIKVVYFSDYAPTPIVAFAARTLETSAAVVVTASHNPPQDNGYKVYDANAAQIIPPTDTAISNAIIEIGPANEVPRIESAFSQDHPGIAEAPSSIIDDYWEEVDAIRPHRPENTVGIVYTPLHGVGGETLLDIFARTAHKRITAVPSQVSPDGRFPTVDFPNPEEPGALDQALELGKELSADLVIGNDPDADRLAAAVPFEDDWRLFTGNELGVLLGSYILSNWSNDETPITGCSIVSSPMLGLIADELGATHLTTLTGFKWIANAAMAVEKEGGGRFAFGYEEALGYTVGQVVRDKDGISAALFLADLAAHARSEGRTLLDILADLWDRYGIWVSTQKSMVRPGESGRAEILAAVERIASDPPNALGGLEVTKVVDYRQGAEERPPWLGAQSLVELELGSSGRVLTRPSGTEPKLKIYVDTTEPVAAADGVHRQREEALTKAERIADEVHSLIVG